jgi:predicted amidohydrolase YtcJ
MLSFTRGEFLGLMALFLGGAALRDSSAAEPQRPAEGAGEPPGPPGERAASSRGPDLIAVNARVLTSDDALPRAQAFAVKHGRFLAVGSNDEIRALAARDTQIFDAAGMTVTPGFIDTHCHPSGVNELYGVATNLPSKAAIIAALRSKAAATPPDFWVQGFMYDDTKVAEGPLTRRDLDQVSSAHPVSVSHRGGHTTVYNSRAFELAGVTRATPDPKGGRFERGADGELTGKVEELARGAFARAGKREELGPQEQRRRGQAGMAHISGLLTAAGLTTVHDAGANSDRLRAYRDAYAAGELRHRAYLMVRGREIFEGLKAAGISTGFGDEWVRIGGVKFAADGSASERTMYMSAPYEGRDDHGILTMTQQEIHEAVEDAHRHGFQVGIHANGDVAIDMVLQAYERVLQQWPHPDRRHRIEHCSLVNPELVRRIAATGSIPTPFWTYVHYHGEKWKEYGEQRMKSMFAHRTFLDAGIRVPGASDYTPGPFEPLMAIQSMVTRKDYAGRVWGENQKVSVDEALKIATLHGAYASYEEASKGSITPGKLADFAVLERDPHEVDPDRIKDIRVVRTVVGGRTVHPRSAA